MSESSLVKQPAYAGSTLAVLTAACVVGVLASHPLQVSIAGVEAVGAVLLLGSGLVRRRGHRIIGGMFVIGGSSLLCLSLGLSLVAPGGLFERIVFLGGALAAGFVTLGLFPLKQTWARGFNGLGAGLFSCSLVVLAWVSTPSSLQLFVGVGLTIVTWDIGKYAITLGEDVGRSAQTYSVTGMHFIGSLGVGVVAGVVAVIITQLTLPAVPIAALALFLSAVLLLLFVVFLGDTEWLSEREE